MQDAAEQYVYRSEPKRAQRTHKTTLVAVNSFQMMVWREDRALAEPWHRFVRLCKSLAADGFDYAVSIKPVGDQIWLEITGTAGPAARKRKPAHRVAVVPAKVTPARIAKEKAEALRLALPPAIHARPSWHWDRYRIGGPRNRAEDKRIGRVIARAIALKQTEVLANTVYPDSFGENTTFSLPYLIGQRQKHAAFTEYQEPTPQETRQARLAYLAEYKYWQELEAISGQRDKLRPGVADTLDAADELSEVA